MDEQTVHPGLAWDTYIPAWDLPPPPAQHMRRPRKSALRRGHALFVRKLKRAQTADNSRSLEKPTGDGRSQPRIRAASGVAPFAASSQSAASGKARAFEWRPACVFSGCVAVQPRRRRHLRSRGHPEMALPGRGLKHHLKSWPTADGGLLLRNDVEYSVLMAWRRPSGLSSRFAVDDVPPAPMTSRPRRKCSISHPRHERRAWHRQLVDAAFP